MRRDGPERKVGPELKLPCLAADTLRREPFAGTGRFDLGDGGHWGLRFAVEGQSCGEPGTGFGKHAAGESR